MKRLALAAVTGLFAAAPIALAQDCDLLPVLLGDNIKLSSAVTTNRWDPAAAYNSAENQYLVVWFDSRVEGFNNVYGQRLATDGSLIGGNLDIQVADASHTDPAIAYNSTDNRYLVTWRYQGGGPGSPGFNNAYGSILAADGSPVAANFHVSNGGLEASVVYSPADNRYMHEARNFAGGGASGIRGQRLSTDGAKVGSNITIASAGAPAPAGQIACDTNAGRYLGTWRDQVEQDLRGQLIAADGSLIGGPIILSDIFPGSGLAASVVFDPAGDRYFIAFGDFSSPTIYGRFVTAAGVPEGDVFTIASGLAYSTSPYVAYNGHDGTFFIAWQNGSAIEGRLMLDDGSFCGDPITLVADTAMSRPTVAANDATGDFIVAWPDNRNASHDNHDIFAQLVAVEESGNPCPWDCEDEPDGAVGIDDLVAVINHWGSCPDPPDPCPWDCENEPDGAVGIDDLVAVINHWGPCP